MITQGRLTGNKFMTACLGLVCQCWDKASFVLSLDARVLHLRESKCCNPDSMVYRVSK